MSLTLGETIAMTTTALATADEVIRLIGEATDDLGTAQQQAATRMMIVQMLVGYTCLSVGQQSDKHPRDVLEKLIDMLADKLPQKEVEMPKTTRKASSGPSPWGNVR